MNTTSSLVEQLRVKEYRDAFVASQIRISLPMQCRALRESRGWTQPQLAEAAGMSQPRISEIERPGERKLNLDTLLRLSSAFDVALQVRFVPFSALIDEDDSIDFDSFYVENFAEDIARLERVQDRIKKVTTLNPLSALGKALADDQQNVASRAASVGLDAHPSSGSSSVEILRAQHFGAREANPPSTIAVTGFAQPTVSRPSPVRIERTNGGNLSDIAC